MTTIKAFTSLEQSRKLAEILPLESADMHYNTSFVKGTDYVSYKAELTDYNSVKHVMSMIGDESFEIIPCWSLAALLEQIPERIYDKQGTQFDIEINKQNGMYSIFYEYDDHGIYHHVNVSCMDTLLDACYEIILKLHEEDKI